MFTKVIWDEKLQAHIEVGIPGTCSYDKHEWSFVYPDEEARYCRRMSKSQADQAQAAKADARWHCEQARIARADGRKHHLVEHLREAERLIRTAYRVGQQSRLNMARADRLSASTQAAAE